MFDQLQQMLRERLGLGAPTRQPQPYQSPRMPMFDNGQAPGSLQTMASDINAPGMVHPQFQQTPGSEGSALQGQQYDDRLHSRLQGSPVRLQNTVNPQRLRLR